MIVSRMVCLFMVYSVMGWVYETTFCTVKGGKWENRGFLYGPVCPIYGTGAVAISLVVQALQTFDVELRAWWVFIVAVIGSAVLEYVTSWVLEKLFHALWWDYSNLPLNLNGRISLFTGLGFGVAGILVVYLIAPFTEKAMSYVSPMVAEVCALVLISLFMVDLTLTVSALLHFDRIVMQAENTFNSKMEKIVDHAVNQTAGMFQDITAKGLEARVNMLGGFAKSAVRRVNTFRYKEEAKEKLDMLLHMIKGRKGHGNE